MRRPRSPRCATSVPGSVFRDGTPTNLPPMMHLRVKYVAATTWTSLTSTCCLPSNVVANLSSFSILFTRPSGILFHGFLLMLAQVSEETLEAVRVWCHVEPRGSRWIERPETFAFSENDWAR